MDDGIVVFVFHTAPVYVVVIVIIAAARDELAGDTVDGAGRLRKGLDVAGDYVGD